MEDAVWSYGLSPASSRGYRSTHKSQPEYFIEIDEFEGEEDEDSGLEFPCPYCSEDFDLLELCYHIDEEHHSESKSGVCTVCSARVKDMVGHITSQHLDVLKGHQKLKPYYDYKDEFRTISLSRKELEDVQYRLGLGGRSSVSSASTSLMALDPLLSFVNNTRSIDKSDKLLPASSDASLEEKQEQESSKPILSESVSDPPPLSEKDQEEQARRCEFVRGMLMSTFLNDDL